MSKQEKQDIESWIERITNNEMPIFGRTVQEVIRVSESDKSSAAQLSQAVLNDASMTGRVLKLANSVYYKRGERKFSTISRAISLLGFDTVRSMCLTVALIDSLGQGNNREHLVREMARSLHAATQARLIAQERNDKSPEEIYICTLLFRIGDMAFWCFCGEEGERVDAALKKPGVTPESAQREVLGFSLNELSSGLAEKWSLGDLLKSTLENPDRKEARAQSIVLSHELAVVAEQGWESVEVHRLTQELSKLATTETHILREKIHKEARQAVKNVSYYGAKVIADIIPLPVQLDEKTSEEEAVDEQYYPEPDSGLQLKILQELTKLTARSSDINTVMEMILEGIHSGVGMDRALFALMTPDRQSLSIKHVLGDQANDLQKNFSFKFSEQSGEILMYCMEQKQSLWLDANSPPELSSKVSRKLVDITGTAAFMLAPIVVKNKVIGLYYSDRAPSKRKLEQESFDSFQFFTQQSNMILNHLVSKQ